MKKVYLLFLILSMVGLSFAQNLSSNADLIGSATDGAQLKVPQFVQPLTPEELAALPKPNILPGTQTKGTRAVYLSQDFEASFSGSPAAPSGWTQSRVVLNGTGTPNANSVDGEKDWQQNTWSGTAWQYPSSSGTVKPTGAVSGTGVLYLEDYYFGGTTTWLGSRRVESPSVNLTSATNPYVRFYYFYAQGSSSIPLRLMASNDNGATWNSIMVIAPNAGATTMTAATPWQRINVAIPAAYKVANAKFGIEMTNTYGLNDVFIDDFTIEDFTPTTITSAATGNWSATATWVGGVVPTADNHVVIAAGHTVSSDVNIARCQNLTVNGTFQYSGTSTTQLVQVFGNVQVNAGGSLKSFSGTTGKRFYLGGSLTNDGTVDFSIGAGNLVWLGGAPATLGGSGTFTGGFISNSWHMNSGGVTYNVPIQIRNTIGLYCGSVNPNGNLTAGGGTVTTQTIERSYLGSFTQAPIWFAAVNRSVTYYTVNVHTPGKSLFTTGHEIRQTGGVGYIEGTLLLSTFDNVQLGVPTTLGTAALGTLTMTRGILVTTDVNLLTLSSFATGSTGTAPTIATSPLTHITNHGSYISGPIRINFPSTGTASRNFPLGYGTEFSGPARNGNILKTITFASTAAWTGSTVKVNLTGAPSGTANSPINNVIGTRGWFVDLLGGPEMPSVTTVTIRGINNTGGNSDQLLGDQSELRIAQSPALTGPWTNRSNTSGTGALVDNTYYTRTSPSAAPGPIVPFSTNGGYFAFATTMTAAGPSGVSATAVSPTQINVAFTPNAGNNNVVIIYNLTGTFTDPTGAPPAVGQAFAGGTVLYNGLTSPVNHTGLNPATTYYYKAFSYTGSVYSTGVAVNATTQCQPVSSFPWTESFEGVTIPAIPSCWYKENGDWATTNNANNTYDADARTGTQFLRESYLATNEYIWSPGFQLTAGTSYDFSFWWAGDTYSGWTGDVFYNTAATSAGATQMGASFVENATTTTKTYAKVARTLVPVSSGVYYFAIRVNCPTSTPWYLSFDDFTFGLTPPPCTAPAAQPTALSLTPTTTTVAGSFTASATASGYVVVQSSSATLGGAPVNMTTYAPGASIGSGTVVSSGTGTTFTASSLTGNTQYYYFVFAYAQGDNCLGPVYRTSSPLSGNTTTLPAAPASFTASPVSASQISFTATPNAAGNNIIVAWNTSNTFGSPTGSLVAGQTITGGGTVHYVGSAAGLYAHAGLMEGTTYYYRIWTVVSGPKYSSTYLNANATTFYSVPYIQDFNAALTLPGGWAGTGSVFAISSTHGNNSSNGLYKNIYSSVPNANVSTPTIIVPAGSPCRLVFDYRIVNFTSYPSTATTLGANDKVEVKYSTDNGSTYNVLFTINQANHITSTAFANTRIDLSALSGPVKFQFLATWGVGDYYVDIDNFKVEVTPTEPIFTINPSSKDFGTVSIFGVSAPQTFTFSNEGIGTINLSGTTITGTNPADFILVDNNAYPLFLGEGQSATVQVYFDPSSAGAKATNLVLSEANDGKLNHTVSLTGVGLDPTVVSFPFRETFEPASPSRSGWLAYNADGGGTNWAYTTAQNHTPGGTTSAYHVYYSSADQEGWFITPPIQLPSGSDYALSFWSYNNYPLDYVKNSVLISTGSMNPNDGEYVEIWTTDEVVASWVETAGLSLGAYAGQQIYIAFKYEGYNAHDWYIDDVLINTPLNVTFESTPLSCNGSNDGTITLNIVGGTPPYTINVLGPNDYFGDQATLTNLAAGEYYYSVTDAEPTTASGTIVITQPDAIPTPTAENLTVTYDGMLHTINGVAPAGTSLVWYDAASGGEVIEAPSETNAGVYNAWVAAFDAVAGCESARVAVVLTINKKGLTVTADNKTKCQFTPNPELTFAYAGFVAGEGTENLETAPTATTTALPNSAPGTYPITLGGGVSSNYSFTYVNATLTVIKSPIINAGPDGSVCSGESFQFVAASASNYTTILWTTSGNGTFSSTSAVNPVYTPGSLDIANGSATLTLTGDPGSSCSQQSSMVLTIQNDLQVSVEVIQVTEDVCVGTLVHFMALPTNGGLTPAYQWKVNGTNAGTNSSDFAYVPANNDVVTVVLTSSIGCALNNPATSAPLTVHVTSDLTAGVSIFANATSVCDFTSVTFTAVPENGGSNPSYQWFVNNVVSGANASTFSFIPLDGDEVHVVMTSNHACAVVPVATSNTVEMNVAPPFLELFANPVNGGTVNGSGNYPAGTEVTVVATPSSGWEFLNWKNADGTVISTNASYVHTINYCYEALTATFSSTAKIAGQLKYFNNQETIIPSPNNYGVFYVQLFEGETAIGERQLLRYNIENGLDSYYEYIGVESGKDYKLRIWEQATNNQLGNVWTWNNWGGTTANDALIIGFMTANNPILTQLPWIAPVAVPNYTPLFSKVADMNNSNSLTGVDALLLQYVMTGAPGYMPLPGGAHNFRLATTRLPNHGAMAYPNAPELLFTPFGNYQATTTASDVYHEVSLNNLSDGLNVFNIYLVSSGDVNASYKPGINSKMGADINYDGLLAAKEGEVVIIPVKVNQSIDFAAMSIGFNFDNNHIEVLSVENYPIHYIDNEASTVKVAWVDQQGKSLSNGDDLMLIKARIVGNLQSGDRYFELMPDVEFADINASVIGGVGLTIPYIESGVTGLNDSQQSLAHSAYPNPFRGQTRINYLLPEAGKVKISLYNNFGQEIKILVDENLEAGSHQLLVNSSDLKDAGQYFYRISLDGLSKFWTVKGTLIYVE